MYVLPSAQNVHFFGREREFMAISNDPLIKPPPKHVHFHCIGIFEVAPLP
jgi:hypothetical protein